MCVLWGVAARTCLILIATAGEEATRQLLANYYYLSLLGIFYGMRLLNLSINLIADFCPHLGNFFFCFSHYVSAKWLKRRNLRRKTKPLLIVS